MFKTALATSISLAFLVSLAAAADAPTHHPKLTAAEIAEKNVAARGGLQAWREVKTLSMEGIMGAGGNQRAALPFPKPGPKASAVAMPTRPEKEVELPFLMEQERPRKMRVELQFNGQTAIQVYDGVDGWKLRPFLNRREVETYTADELKAASQQPDLDGFLIDYAAKGSKVELDGTEKVEDRLAYKLKLTTKTGQVKHIWIDAETFLEAKVEGQPRRLDGIYHSVEVYYRDYRKVAGLQIPYVLETRVLPLAQPVRGVVDTPVPAEKIVIDKIVVNPPLEDKLFKKPDPGK